MEEKKTERERRDPSSFSVFAREGKGKILEGKEGKGGRKLEKVKERKRERKLGEGKREGKHVVIVLF